MKRRSALLLATLPGLANHSGRQAAKQLDFNGKVSSGAALSAKWKIRVTPKVLFF